MSHTWALQVQRPPRSRDLKVTAASLPTNPRRRNPTAMLALTVLALSASGAVVPMLQQPANCSMVKAKERVDCGHPGITEKGCLATPGCCYGGRCSATVPCCYYSQPRACKPKPCPHHPGHTYCPSDSSPGQCDKPPRGTCPPGPCGPPPPPPAPPPPPFAKTIKTVHIVQSCHLDVGFADTCAGITNRYFDKFYLDVVQTAANLSKADPSGPQLTFLTYRNVCFLRRFILKRSFYQDRLGTNVGKVEGKPRSCRHPYLISLYFDCPEGYPGLHCPDAASKATVAAALKAGTIYLQGFPHSGEPETFDAGTLAAALEFSRNVSLTHAPDRPPSKSYSQRDVPVRKLIKPPFWRHFYPNKPINLPRQARDEQSENSNEREAFLRRGSHEALSRFLQSTVRNTPWFEPNEPDRSILPRQARDKHRKSRGKQRDAFLAGIEIVSIGSNGANEAPTELPGKNPAGGAPVFRWQVRKRCFGSHY